MQGATRGGQALNTLIRFIRQVYDDLINQMRRKAACCEGVGIFTGKHLSTLESIQSAISSC